MNLSYDKETGLVTWTLYQEEEEIGAESSLNIKTYTVPEYFLPFLINGQCSGLNQEDFDQFKDFIEREEIDESLGHWSYDEQEPYFSWKNDVTNKGSSVVEVQWVEIPSRTPGLLKGQLGDAFFEPLSEEELQQFN